MTHRFEVHAYRLGERDDSMVYGFWLANDPERAQVG